MCSTREGMHYPWVISSVPVSHILSTRESYPQYLWRYAVPMSHIISTRESYPQYPWVIFSESVSHILSTRKDMQCPWVISSVPVRVCSTHESHPQYSWGYAVPMSKFIWMKNEWKLPHGYCISSQVLHILTGTEDMTHGYWGYDSRVLRIWLTGTAYPHRYCIPLRVLRIWLTGTAYPHRYWGYDSRVLRIWLTGTNDMTHK